MSETYVDVLIVGGGMVGGLLAGLLANSALKIMVLDQQKAPLFDGDGPYTPRVSAVTPASRQLLDAVGAWSAISASRCGSFNSMQVWDGDGTGEVVFDSNGIGHAELGYIVENHLIQSAIFEVCQHKSNIDWLAPADIVKMEHVGAQVKVELSSGAVVIADMLVGADGANSFVRKQFSISVKQNPYNHQAVVTTVKTARCHNQCARQVFLSGGPLALLPLSDPYYCSIVWSMAPEQAESMLALKDAQFNRHLFRHMGRHLGDVEVAGERFSFPLLERHAESYSRQSVVLVGDAAHTIHPLAGQGVNLGFLDAGVLAEEVLRGVKSGLDVADSLTLKKYERRRRSHVALMMSAMKGFQGLFAQENIYVRLFRNMGMAGFNRLPYIKDKVLAGAMGLVGDLPECAKQQK